MGHEIGNPIENEQLCKSAQQAFKHGGGLLSNLPGLIQKIIEVRAWESRTVRGRLIEFKSLREMITSKVTAGGWQEDPKKIESVIKDDPEVLTVWREAMKEKTGPKSDNSFCNNITEINKGTGTSKAYTLSRLKRESPELFQAVCDGEMSANAAAIKAGFRKKPTGLQLLQRAYNKATEDEYRQFLEWIKDDEKTEAT